MENNNTFDMASKPFRLKNGRRSPRFTSSTERLPSYESDRESIGSDAELSANGRLTIDSDFSPRSSISSPSNLSPFEFSLETFDSFSEEQRPSNLLERSIARLPPGSDLKNTLLYIRKQMKSCLLRLKELEEEARNVPTLRVRISVLQEEKRQLLKQLQAKVSMKKGSYFNPATRGCRSDSEDNDGFSSVRQKLRANLSSSMTSLSSSDTIKSVSTKSCQTSLCGVKGTLVKDQSKKLTVNTRSIGVGMIRSFTKNTGVGNSKAVINLKDEGTQNVPVMIPIGCDSRITECYDKSTIHKPVVRSIATQASQPLWIPFADEPQTVSSATQTPPKPTKVSIGVGVCTIDDEIQRESKTIDEIIANKIDLPVLRSTGVGEFSVTDDSSCTKITRNFGCGTELKLKTVGVGLCRVTDSYCANCDSKRTRSIGVGNNDVTSLIREDISTRSIGVGTGTTDCPDCMKNQNDAKYLSQINHSKELVNIKYIDHQTHLVSQDKKLYIVENGEAVSDGSCTLTHVSSSDDESSIDHDNPSSDSTGQMSESSVNGQRPTYRVNEDVLSACRLLNGHLYKGKEVGREQLVSCMSTVEINWFDCVSSASCSANAVRRFTKTIKQYIPVLLDTFINLKDKNGNNALHYAVTYGNWRVVNVLLSSNDLNVDVFNQAGYTAVMLASLAGIQGEGSKEIVRRLLDMGDVNMKAEKTGQTPLMLAVSCGRLEMVELLLEADADINAQDNEFSTALMCACEHGHTDIARILLTNPHCNSGVQDNDGSTALSIAMEHNFHDIALLIYGHSNFTYQDNRNKKISNV